MNFYRHHIGDYRRDTMHLSLVEHGAYRQLLDLYYLQEQKLSTDVDNICRKICARSAEERAAVETVLAEFFVLTAEGYTHRRCEEELAAMTDLTGDYEERRANERERKRRHRERRAELFAQLRDKGIVPKWDVTTAELERLLSADQPTPVTSPETGQGQAKDGDGTANQYPVPTTHSRQRGSRLPSDWKPSAEDVAYLQSKRPDLSLEDTAESFRDYWVSVPGAKGVKLDWAATWRNWVKGQKASFPVKTLRPARDPFAGAV